MTKTGEHEAFPVTAPVEVKPELVFMDAGEGINVPETPSGTVKIKVNAPYRIVHGGKVYVGGDVLEAPNDDTTTLWLKAKWAEPVPASRKARK